MNNKHLRLSLRYLFAPTAFLLLTLLVWLSAGSVFSDYAFAQESAAVAVEIAAPSSIAGRVVGLDGAPLARVIVGLIPLDKTFPQQTTTTAEDGTYKFEPLGAGIYRIAVAPQGAGNYLTKYFPDADTLADAEEIFVASNTVQLEDIQIVRGGALEGMVRTTDGQPLSELQIFVSQNLGDTETPELTSILQSSLSIITPTSTISFSVNGLVDGLYRICATGEISGTGASAADCYSQAGSDIDVAQDISVTHSTTVTIDIDLTPVTLYAISGTVFSLDGEPLSDVAVSPFIRRADGGWSSRASIGARTDEDGRYQIDRLLAGTYTLRFTNMSNNYIYEYLGNSTERDSATTFTVGDGTVPSAADFVARKHASISGVVKSTAGEPLAGIAVSLVATTTNSNRSWGTWISTDITTQTDENGEYKLEVRNHVAGYDTFTNTLRFANPDDEYIDEFLGNSIDSTGVTTFTVQLGEQITNMDFVARKGATVTGQVTYDGGPFSRDFTVEAHQQVGTSWMKTISVEPVDNAGNFRIQGLSPGRYKFVVVATFDNIQTSWYFGSAAFETATEVELDVGDDLSNIDIDFKTNVFDGVLAGRVIYQGEPVENIMVEIDRQSDGYHLPTIKVSTDADGQFRVDGVVAGSYCIRYTDPNGVYATANNGNAFVNGSCQRISLDAGEERTNLGRHLTLGGTISGQITDVDGPLAAPVEVIAYVYNGSRRGWRSTEISTFTDADGRYTLAGLLSRTYRLGFKHQTESETKWLYSGLARTVESAQDISVASGEKVADINVAFGLLELLSPRSFLPIMFESN